MNKFTLVVSPYAGNVKRNVKYAKRCMSHCLSKGFVPFVSHLLFTQILDDSVRAERELGMACGNWVIKHKIDYAMVYTDYGISAGMKAEIELLTKLGIVIQYLKIGVTGATGETNETNKTTS